MVELKLTFATVEEAAALLGRLAPGAYTPIGVSDEADGYDTEGTAAAGDQPARRRRRTKAEMEAARQAEDAVLVSASPTPVSAPAADASSTNGALPSAVAAQEDTTSAAPPTEAPAELEIRANPEDRKPARTKDEADAFFREKVRPALGAVMKERGQDNARVLLEKFGFDKLSAVTPERYDALVALCERAAVSAEGLAEVFAELDAAKAAKAHG